MFPVGTGSGGSWSVVWIQSGCFQSELEIRPGVIWSRDWNLLCVQGWGVGTLSGCSRRNVGIFTAFPGGVVGVLSDGSGFALEADPGEPGPGVGIFLSAPSPVWSSPGQIAGLSLAWRLETHPVYVAQCGGPHLGVRGLGLEPALEAAWVLFGPQTLSLA